MLTTTVPLPSFVQIEPVGQCNLRCQMCPIQFRTDGPPNGPPAFMPFEAFRARLDSDDPPDICRSCAVYNHTF